jgi:hypothetical protein
MTAFFAVLSLLFSQLALANYVCPGEADAMAMAEMVAAGEPCAGMDTAQPALCHQHAAGMSASFEQIKLTVPSLPAVVQAMVLPLLLPMEGRDVPVQARPEQHPPPDPVFLATRRLRV